MRKHRRLEGSSFNKKPNIRTHLNFYLFCHFVNTWIPYKIWGDVTTNMQGIMINKGKRNCTQIRSATYSQIYSGFLPDDRKCPNIFNKDISIKV